MLTVHSKTKETTTGVCGATAPLWVDIGQDFVYYLALMCSMLIGHDDIFYGIDKNGIVLSQVYSTRIDGHRSLQGSSGIITAASPLHAMPNPSSGDLVFSSVLGFQIEKLVPGQKVSKGLWLFIETTVLNFLVIYLCFFFWWYQLSSPLASCPSTLHLRLPCFV